MSEEQTGTQLGLQWPQQAGRNKERTWSQEAESGSTCLTDLGVLDLWLLQRTPELVP